MRRLFIASLIGVAALSLVGCAAAPEIPYDRGAAGEVKSIGIITPAFPDGPTVWLASSVGQSFGLVGALVDAGMQSSREATFKSLLDEQKFSARDCFLEKLTAGLREAGYTVAIIPIQRQGSDFATHYPTEAEPKVDAYLDVVANSYGYAAAGIRSSTPYRPWFVVRARLVSAKDSSVLMQDAVMYNPINAPGHVITIPPDPTTSYSNFDHLVADPAGAVKGLQAATEQSALTLGKLLR
jgi:hypothetical protein